MRKGAWVALSFPFPTASSSPCILPRQDMLCRAFTKT